jgi:hypothetical protein
VDNRASQVFDRPPVEPLVGEPPRLASEHSGDVVLGDGQERVVRLARTPRLKCRFQMLVEVTSQVLPEDRSVVLFTLAQQVAENLLLLRIQTVGAIIDTHGIEYDAGV